jgi:hypothetical protein
MSEKMYTRLFRLYPSSFRKQYEGEALQLVRDRLRDETGFFKRARLVWDLVADVLAGLPQAYRNSYAVTEEASVSPDAEGIPSFKVLDEEPLGRGSLLIGGTLSLATIVAFGFLRGPSGALPEASEMTSVHGDIVAPVAKDASLDAAERRRVITAAINNLRQHYFDREVAQETAGALLAHEKNGDDDAAKDGVVFADLLTRQMRDASHDMHLVMEYSREILPEQPPEPTPESLARYRKAMEQQNCMFRKIEILSHNIGYLKVDFFPDTSVCQSTATAAMAALNHAAAIIFDLRDNAGGFPGMVTLIAGYLFDHPEYMYGPRGAPTEEFWTHSPIPGNTLADKPVYVLTSASTWSGAEQFSYDLKMLKRATLVGETTRGGAHAGAFHRIDDHFGMGIPEEKAINPFGKADWEGVGVEPDVKVRAAEALETAMKLAEASVGTK